MIGVYVRDDEKENVAEFFELFKTPWEFAREGVVYPAALATLEPPPSLRAERWLLFYSDPSAPTPATPRLIRHAGAVFPIFGKLTVFPDTPSSLVRTQREDEAVSRREASGRLRIGYDLLSEIGRLLSVGQPPEFAAYPTLDEHVALVRDMLLGWGVPVMEIAPAPAGSAMLACLTHDVDFVRISDHGINHTVRGFVVRALAGSVMRWRRGELTFLQVLQNWGAVASLPLVWLGWKRDFWEEFDRYMDIERLHASTYFMMPFKNRPGRKVALPHPERRATCYDVTEVVDDVRRLKAAGHEIALHGIDAWLDVESAREETARIAGAAGSCAGTRMHWLCFDEKASWVALDQAGLEYDSTCGYNETVGFKAGTTQAFRPPDCRTLLEVPLHLQDVALFYPTSLGLSPTAARETCTKVLDAVERHGGLATVLWHTRSLSPERLWGDAYRELIRDLERRKAWFGTAAQIASWFRRRRAVAFGEVSISPCEVRAHLSDPQGGAERLVLRISLPEEDRGGRRRIRRVDVPWNGDQKLAFRREGGGGAAGEREVAAL